MRNLFALVGAGTIAFVGLGWYLGWYSLTRQPGATGGTQRFQVDLNPTKITDDMHKGITRVGEITDRLSDDKSAPKDPQPAPAQPQTNATPTNNSGEPVNENVFSSLQNVKSVGSGIRGTSLK